MNEVIKQYEKVCNNLAEEINKRLFDNSRYINWIGDDIGEVCDFEEIDFLNPYDMILILKYNLSYEQYAKWRDYNLEHAEQISLIHWINNIKIKNSK